VATKCNTNINRRLGLKRQRIVKKKFVAEKWSGRGRTADYGLVKLEKGGRSALNGRRRSAKLTIPPSSDARPCTVVYRTDRQAPSAARFCRAGQLATAGTCFSCDSTIYATSIAQLSPRDRATRCVS